MHDVGEMSDLKIAPGDVSATWRCFQCLSDNIAGRQSCWCCNFNRPKLSINKNDTLLWSLFASTTPFGMRVHPVESGVPERRATRDQRQRITYQRQELPEVPIPVHESLTNSLHALPGIRSRRLALEALAAERAAAVVKAEEDAKAAAEERWKQQQAEIAARRAKEQEERQAYYAAEADRIAAERAEREAYEKELAEAHAQAMAQAQAQYAAQQAEVMAQDARDPRLKAHHHARHGRAAGSDSDGDSYESSSDESDRGRAAAQAAKKRKAQAAAANRGRAGAGASAADAQTAGRPGPGASGPAKLKLPVVRPDQRLPVYFPTAYEAMEAVLAVTPPSVTETQRDTAVSFLKGTLLHVIVLQLARRGDRAAAVQINDLANPREARVLRAKLLALGMEKAARALTIESIGNKILTKLEVAKAGPQVQGTAGAAVPPSAADGATGSGQEAAPAAAAAAEPEALAAFRRGLISTFIPQAVARYISLIERLSVLCRHAACQELVTMGLEGRLEAPNFLKGLFERMKTVNLPPLPLPTTGPVTTAAATEVGLPVVVRKPKPAVPARTTALKATGAGLAGPTPSKSKQQVKVPKAAKLRRERDVDSDDDDSGASSSSGSSDDLEEATPKRGRPAGRSSAERPTRGRGRGAKAGGTGRPRGRPPKSSLGSATKATPGSGSKKTKPTPKRRERDMDDEAGGDSDDSWELPAHIKTLPPEAQAVAIQALREGANKEDVAAWVPQGVSAADIAASFQQQMELVREEIEAEEFSDEEEVVNADDDEDADVDMDAILEQAAYTTGGSGGGLGLGGDDDGLAYADFQLDLHGTDIAGGLELGGIGLDVGGIGRAGKSRGAGAGTSAAGRASAALPSMPGFDIDLDSVGLGAFLQASGGAMGLGLGLDQGGTGGLPGSAGASATGATGGLAGLDELDLAYYGGGLGAGSVGSSAGMGSGGVTTGTDGGADLGFDLDGVNMDELLRGL